MVDRFARDRELWQWQPEDPSMFDYLLLAPGAPQALMAFRILPAIYLSKQLVK